MEHQATTPSTGRGKPRFSYLELGDYCAIAAELLGTTPRRIESLPRVGLVGTALASPQAGYGEHDTYPTLIEKAAVLIGQLAPHRPLPDANKRAALLTVCLFMELNGQPFRGQEPDTDVPMVERIAAGEATIGEISVWLEQRTTSRS